MSSVAEILREFRYRPRLAPDLLREVLRVDVPTFESVRSENVDGGAPRDAETVVVVLVRDANPVHGIVIVAPDGCHSALRLSWPRWTKAVARRISAPTSTLVITADPVVERWARQPVHLPPEPPFEPYVIGPSAIPSDGQNTPVLVLMALAARITNNA